MLFIDTSALLKRYVAEDGTELVTSRMLDDGEWAVSALARAEAEIALCRLGFSRDEHEDRWQRLREDLERCHMVPVDPACLERASEIGCEFEIRTLDALHLAGADRLPRPLTLLTFDRPQADAPRRMNFVVEGA